MISRGKMSLSIFTICLQHFCVGGHLSQMVWGSTVWKFKDCFIAQILREINLGDSRSAKSVILTHLEALNFDFYEFLHCLKAEISQINQIQAP